jgi:hypothetical protein
MAADGRIRQFLEDLEQHPDVMGSLTNGEPLSDRLFWALRGSGAAGNGEGDGQSGRRYLRYSMFLPSH